MAAPIGVLYGEEQRARELFQQRDKLDLYFGSTFCFGGHCAMVVQLYRTPLVEHEVFDFKTSIYLRNIDHEGPGELEIAKKKKKEKKKPSHGRLQTSGTAGLENSFPR